MTQSTRDRLSHPRGPFPWIPKAPEEKENSRGLQRDGFGMAPLPTLRKLRLGSHWDFFPCYFNLFLSISIFHTASQSWKKNPGMCKDPSLLYEARKEALASGITPNSPQTPKNSSPGEFPAPTENSSDYFQGKYGIGDDYCNYSERKLYSSGNWRDLGRAHPERWKLLQPWDHPRGSEHPDPMENIPDHCRFGFNWI